MSLMPDERRPNDERHAEHAVQIATRFVALLRTARSYQIGNQVITTQVEHFLAVLQSAFADHGEIQLLDFEGDLHLNGMRLPLRGANMRFLEQLQQELHAREIAGLVFVPGLKAPEFEAFLRFFLATDAYKGMELFHACEANGIGRIFPAFLAVEAEPDSAPGTTAQPAGRSEAVATYQRALQLVELFTSPTKTSGGELRHLKRIVQPLVDAALGGESNPGFEPGAMDRPTAGEHALQVAMAAIQVGAKLGLDRRALAELGAGALLHDSGKSPLAAELRAPVADWTAEQHELARRHPLEGLKQIAHGSSLNESSLSAIRIALEHHTYGPQPYPALPADHVRSPLSEIVAIADAWVSLASGERTPSEALGAVLGPLGAGFDPAVRAALVRALGLYPAGQRVELDDGSLARVIHAGATDPARPDIEWLTGPGREALPADRPGATGPLPAERHIVRALPRAEWPAPARDAA